MESNDQTSTPEYDPFQIVTLTNPSSVANSIESRSDSGNIELPTFDSGMIALEHRLKSKMLFKHPSNLNVITPVRDSSSDDFSDDVHSNFSQQFQSEEQLFQQTTRDKKSTSGGTQQKLKQSLIAEKRKRIEKEIADLEKQIEFLQNKHREKERKQKEAKTQVNVFRNSVMKPRAAKYPTNQEYKGNESICGKNKEKPSGSKDLNLVLEETGPKGKVSIAIYPTPVSSKGSGQEIYHLIQESMEDDVNKNQSCLKSDCLPLKTPDMSNPSESRQTLKRLEEKITYSYPGVVLAGIKPVTMARAPNSIELGRLPIILVDEESFVSEEKIQDHSLNIPKIYVSRKEMDAYLQKMKMDEEAKKIKSVSIPRNTNFNAKDWKPIYGNHPPYLAVQKTLPPHVVNFLNVNRQTSSSDIDLTSEAFPFVQRRDRGCNFDDIRYRIRELARKEEEEEKLRETKSIKLKTKFSQAPPSNTARRRIRFFQRVDSVIDKITVLWDSNRRRSELIRDKILKKIVAENMERRKILMEKQFVSLCDPLSWEQESYIREKNLKSRGYLNWSRVKSLNSNSATPTIAPAEPEPEQTSDCQIRTKRTQDILGEIDQLLQESTNVSIRLQLMELKEKYNTMTFSPSPDQTTKEGENRDGKSNEAGRMVGFLSMYKNSAGPSKKNDTM